jgi:hypothetical protein
LGVYGFLSAFIIPSLLTIIVLSNSGTVETLTALALVVATLFLTSKIDNNEKLFIKMPVIVSGLIIGVVASGSVLLVKSFF